MTNIQMNGILEIDTERGVIYFHEAVTGFTKLRICRLPTPIPNPKGPERDALDVTFGYGVSWDGHVQTPPELKVEQRSALQQAAEDGIGLPIEPAPAAKQYCESASLTKRDGHKLICKYVAGHRGTHSWMALLTVAERLFERANNPAYELD